VSLGLSVGLSVCLCLEVRYLAGVRALVRPAWPGHCPMCLSLCLSVCLSLCVSGSVCRSVCLSVSRSEVSSWSSGTGAAGVAGSLSYVSVSLSECLSVSVCLWVCLSVCLYV